MKNYFLNVIIVCAVLFLFGFIKVPLEIKIENEMREDDILPPKIDIVDRNNIGQAGYAAALGGLRDIIASFSFLEAFNKLAEKDWFETERLFNKVTTLQPRSEHYWDSAGYNLAYSAQNNIISDLRLEPYERLRRAKEIVVKGDTFFQRGLKYLPGNYQLQMNRMRLNQDHYRYPDFKKSHEAISELVKTPDLKGSEYYIATSNYVYVLSAMNGNEAHAYKETFNIYKSRDVATRIPSLRVLLYVLQDTTFVKTEQRIAEDELLFHMDEYEDLLTIYSFPKKVELSAKPALEQKYQNLVDTFKNVPPEKRNDVLRAKIHHLEKVLQMESDKRVPEGHLFIDEVHKEEIIQMLSYRSQLDTLSLDVINSFKKLRAKCELANPSRQDKELLAIFQEIHNNALAKERTLPIEMLTYNRWMKYLNLKSYWSAKNSMTQNIIAKDKEGLEIMPVGKIVSELVKLERDLKIPIEQRMKIKDVFTELPY